MEIKRPVGWIAGHAGSPAMAAQAGARLTCVKRPLSLWPKYFPIQASFRAAAAGAAV